MKDEVDTVIGFLDIPPYVTIVPPWLQGTKVHESQEGVIYFNNRESSTLHQTTKYTSKIWEPEKQNCHQHS